MSEVPVTHITCMRCKLTKPRDCFATGRSNRKCRICYSCRNRPQPVPVLNACKMPTQLAIRPSGNEDLPWALTSGGEKYGEFVSVEHAQTVRPIILDYLNAA